MPMILTDKERQIVTFPLIDDDLELIFVEKRFAIAPDNEIPVYGFIMQNRGSGLEMGAINIKAGYTENIIKFRGNIGFAVNKAFRGHRYSGRSCLLLKAILQSLNVNPVYITCNPDNVASKKNIETTGATFLEEIIIPDNSSYSKYYPQDSRRKLRFRWDI